jgi:hypothetical protein
MTTDATPRWPRSLLSAQGVPRVLVVLNPTAGKQSLCALDMQATVDHEEFFHSSTVKVGGQ